MKQCYVLYVYKLMFLIIFMYIIQIIICIYMCMDYVAIVQLYIPICTSIPLIYIIIIIILYIHVYTVCTYKHFNNNDYNMYIVCNYCSSNTVCITLLEYMYNIV